MKNLTPIAINEVTLAFPGDVSHLMPKYSEIPDEFRDGYTPWNKLFNQWFYTELKALPKVKDGIDSSMALRHIGAVMRSFEPKHEYKEAACAYLMSLWLELPEGVKA